MTPGAEPTRIWRPPVRYQAFAPALLPLAAVAVALAVGAVVIVALGADPVEGYTAMLRGGFGSWRGLADSTLRAVPLLLVGTGICIAYRANVINIGGEGQMVAGAIASVLCAMTFGDLSAPLLIPLVLGTGLVGGGLWGAVPGALKAYLGVNEILSTIMLNIVAVQVMNYLLRDPLIDPAEIERGTRIPQTERLSRNADLPILVDGSRLHLGVIVALAAAALAWVLLWRTTTGFRIRAVGHSAPAARYAGIPVGRMTVLALSCSGALCGLAGAVLVFGSQSHRLLTDGSSSGFTGSAGFNGIVVALFAGLHPLWTIPSSLLFGGLIVGANAMQRAVQVPSSLAVALNGLVVVLVICSYEVRARWQLRVGAAEASQADAVRPPTSTTAGAPGVGDAVLGPPALGHGAVDPAQEPAR